MKKEDKKWLSLEELTLEVVVLCKLLLLIKKSGRKSLHSINQMVAGRRTEGDRQCGKEEQKVTDSVGKNKRR